MRRGQYWSSKPRLGGSINCVLCSPSSSHSCHTNLLCVSKASTKRPIYQLSQGQVLLAAQNWLLLCLDTKKKHFSSVSLFSFFQIVPWPRGTARFIMLLVGVVLIILWHLLNKATCTCGKHAVPFPVGKKKKKLWGVLLRATIWNWWHQVLICIDCFV